MYSAGADRRDFFVSFNSADRDWAEWCAAELESAGYKTFFQNWDFLPGSNFPLEMHRAATLADRTLAVLSPDYLKALFTQPEWAAALVQDPTGAQRKLIPIRVRPCEPEGLLRSIVYADLVGLAEPEARSRLIAAVRGSGARPTSVPFPAASAKQFPGAISRAMPKPAHRVAWILGCAAVIAVILVLMSYWFHDYQVRRQRAQQLVDEVTNALAQETGDPTKLGAAQAKCNEALRLVPGFDAARSMKARIDSIARKLQSDDCREALRLYFEARDTFENSKSKLFDPSPMGLSAAREKSGRSVRLCGVLPEATRLLQSIEDYPASQRQ